MADQWFTVSGAYVDTQESFVVHVLAEDAADARSRAYRMADGVVIGLSVFLGRIDAMRDMTTVTPLRGPEHALTVTSVRVTQSLITVPARCPSCRVDLRGPRAVTQSDLVLRLWDGHLSKGGGSVGSDDAKMHLEDVSDAVRLRCRACGYLSWDGIRGSEGN